MHIEMHVVSQQLVLPADSNRHLNSLEFFVRKVYDLLAPHTNDVMMSGCNWIVSHSLVQACQPRDNAMPLERVERLKNSCFRNGRMA
jgi:hypothetical protein